MGSTMWEKCLPPQLLLHTHGLPREVAGTLSALNDEVLSWYTEITVCGHVAIQVSGGM